MSFQPTDEQLQALDHFKAGKSLVIQAGAGSGKTSTLRLLSSETKRRGQLIAFNKSVIADAKAAMPSAVNCSTIHSLAFRAVGWKYKNRLDNSQRMRSMEIARFLGTEPMTVTYKDSKKQLGAGYLASLSIRAIERFCQSGDPVPTIQHVPYVDGIDAPAEGGTRTYGNNDAVRRHILPGMLKAWDDLQRTDGWLPYKHGYYLKAWELGSPVIGADYIMCDEAQDLAPVALSILQKQTDSQLVVVGDSQQSIYGSFTGAVDALERIEADAVCYLTKSWRFGQVIADKANEILERLQAALRLTGNPAITSTIGEAIHPDAILTRTNAIAVATVLKNQSIGRRVHLVGGGSEVISFARAADDLMHARPTSHPELACFSTWNEVVEYVAQDELGGELRLMVNLIEEYSVETIIDALQRMPREESADLVVSTCHKAKGREWRQVQLAGDFPKESPPAEEWRLLYVGVTRAKSRLDISAIPLLAPPEKPQQDPLASFDRLYREQESV